MRYVTAESYENDRNLAYRIYVTDVLKFLASRYTDGEIRRYADMIIPQKEESRTADEIKQSIKEKIKKIGGG